MAGEEDARTLVERLLELRLIACGTVLAGATSVYRWKGKVERETEVLVMLKTSSDLWTELERVVSAEHPYEVPELLAVPVTAGSQPYLDWIDVEIGKRRD